MNFNTSVVYHVGRQFSLYLFWSPVSCYKYCDTVTCLLSLIRKYRNVHYWAVSQCQCSSLHPHYPGVSSYWYLLDLTSNYPHLTCLLSLAFHFFRINTGAQFDIIVFIFSKHRVKSVYNWFSYTPYRDQILKIYIKLQSWMFNKRFNTIFVINLKENRRENVWSKVGQ